MAQIYCTTNLINGKKYIGKNSTNDKSYLGSGSIFKQALKKYKRKSFKKEIIVEGSFNDELLDELERHYIRLYNTKAPFGYNITDGGNGRGVKRTPEVIAKTSRTQFKKGQVPWNKGKKYPNKKKGVPLSEQHKNKLKDNWSKNYNNRVVVARENGKRNRGRECSEEVKKLLSKKFKGRKMSPEVFEKTKHTQFKKGRISVNKGKHLSENHRANISNSTKGKHKTRPVDQYSKDGQFIKSWTSLTEASKNTRATKQHIIEVISGKAKSAKGFVWRDKGISF